MEAATAAAAPAQSGISLLLLATYAALGFASFALLNMFLESQTANTAEAQSDAAEQAQADVTFDDEVEQFTAPDVAEPVPAGNPLNDLVNMGANMAGSFRYYSPWA